MMVFLAAALASASLTIPEGWGEEGKQSRALVMWGHCRCLCFPKFICKELGFLFHHPLPSLSQDQSLPAPQCSRTPG